MSDTRDCPEGYSYEPSVSAFINHVGKVYTKRVERDGNLEVWAALRVESHHVNAWQFCHGAVMASMAEIGTSGPAWDSSGPPVVAIEMSMQFIAAPKLGDLLEVCGTITKRTRSLAFSQALGEVDGNPMFLATSVQKFLAGK